MNHDEVGQEAMTIEDKEPIKVSIELTIKQINESATQNAKEQKTNEIIAKETKCQWNQGTQDP